MFAHVQRFLAVCCVLMTTTAIVAAEMESLRDTLKTRIPQVMEEHHIPGLSMVLIRDHEIAWAKAFGVRVADRPEKVDTETVFEAASMSKPMFAYAVLKLVEEGSFDLDRPLDSYLREPYLPDAPAASAITGRMVMLHRSGLPNWRKGGWRLGGPLQLEHPPDSRFTYSGEGFLYLQRAIEQIEEEPIAEWMQERLLTPLHMNRSSYRWRSRFDSNFAGGHDKDGVFKENRRFYREGNAAFSLYTTPTDYARFLIELMKPDRSAPHSVGRRLLNLMTTLQVECEEGDPRSRRSLAWIVDAPEDGGYVRHTGTNGAGFHCVARFDPGRGSGCVIMSNNVGAREALREILAIIDSLAKAGRLEAIRRAAMLPAADAVRGDCLEDICATSALAQTVLAESKNSWTFRNWFKTHESKLKANGHGQFELLENKGNAQVATTTMCAAAIWRELAKEAAQQLNPRIRKQDEGKTDEEVTAYAIGEI